MIIQGYTINWKVVFALRVESTATLYWPEIFKYIFLLSSHLFLGTLLWAMGHSYIRKAINSRYCHTLYGRYGITSVAFILCLIYSSINLFYPPVNSWKAPSSNAVLSILPAVLNHYTKGPVPVQVNWNKNDLDSIEQFLRAPNVTISKPSSTLEKPIKHIFLIIMESIRADVLPFNLEFIKALRTSLHTNVVGEELTPFFNSLWNESVRATATTVATYTLKSLIGTLCGIYPLNVDFLQEVNAKHKFYEICLPELVRQTLCTSKNSSCFRSAFFTSARDDFDRQRELIKRMKFDDVFSGFNVTGRFGPTPDVGMFGPSDSTILPLLWDWIDNTLKTNNETKLMTSLLLTGTHEPFPMPRNEPNYRRYVGDERANKYLNTIRLTDTILKTIVNGFKSRKLFNETLFVIISDHGYAFRDWGHKALAVWGVPYECTFRVPLVLYNPYLKPKQLNSQYTNMDILPTIMDVLLSSQKIVDGLTNQLLSVEEEQLNAVLSRYEGTSLFRLQNEQERQRYTFHISNPGNSHVIVKQYPLKLVYDVNYDEVRLFHLGYDPQEAIDLISFDRHNYAGTYPVWIQADHNFNDSRNWTKRWNSQRNKLSDYHRNLLQKKFSQQISDIKSNLTRISLNEMLNWADATLELAVIWSVLVKARYHYGNMTLASSKLSL